MAAIVAGVVILRLVGVAGQSLKPGWLVVVRVEARRLPGQTVSEQSARVIAGQFPDGSSIIEYLTDGEAVRSTIAGGMFGLESGAVRLVPKGSSNAFLLNPTARTYRELGQVFSDSPAADVSIQPIKTFKRILGYRAQRVTVSYRQNVKLPPDARPGDAATREVRVDIENWCTNALTVPPAMAAMMSLTSRILAGAPTQFSRHCSLPLESVARFSVLPEFEIVSTTQAIVRQSTFPLGVFVLPTDYREVSTAGPEPSR